MNIMDVLSHKDQKGASLIIIIAIVLIVGIIGAVFVSLINTESFTAMHQSAGEDAFALADSGLEYGKKYLRSFADWYSFSTDPVIPASSTPLGSGNFTTTINFPATALSKSIGAGNTTICVRTKNRFPPFPFYIGIDSEYMQCTGDSGASCYTCTRGVILGGVGIPPAQHFQDAEVDPVVQLSSNIGATDTTIPFTGLPSKFLTRGTITINDLVNGNEEIDYAAIQTSPQAFIGCIRDPLGTSHSAGLPIIPIQSSEQAFLQSTGVRAAILSTNAQRVLTDVINFNP